MRLLKFMFAIGALSLGTSAVNAGVISATNSTFGIFDGTSGTRSVTFTGLEGGYGTGIITDVNISVDFIKADGEGPTIPGAPGTPWYDEIRFVLQSPNAVSTTLIEASSWGAGSGVFDGVITFDDSAANVVNFGAGPVAGTFRPTGAGTLSDFNGFLAAGTWDLFIEDTASADALRFRSFTLNVTTQSFAAVPEPSSFALMGAIGAFGVWKRRRSQKVA